jgi:hypothetical protein
MMNIGTSMHKSSILVSINSIVRNLLKYTVNKYTVKE